MKIKKLSAILLILLSLCFVGCDVPKGDSFLVTHNFDNYGDYKSFYNNFCEYNQERYIMPQDTESIEFIYNFTGVADIEYLNTDYNYLDFRDASTSFEIKDIKKESETENHEYFLIGFSACNIADEYDYVCSHLYEIGFRINKPDMYKHNQSISIVIGDIEIAHTGIGASDFIEDKNFITVMDKIISAYKGGE